MHLYHVDWGSEPAYRRTLAQAHVLAKAMTPDKARRPEARITLKDYPFDQSVFEGLMNRGRRPAPIAELRQWYLNRRGALRELPSVGAEPPLFDDEETP